MSKKTLIEIVSEILSDMSSDYVASISDTEESEQVAQIVQSTYYAMIANRNWPHTLRLLHLTPYSDNDYPTHMKIEDELKELRSVFYNKAPYGSTKYVFEPVRYREPDDFLRLTNARNSDNVDTNVIVDPSGVILLILNNKHPDYYTSFDDENMVFDSWDNSVDSTLQAIKTQARGYIIPQFEMEDDFVPDLPTEAFTALIEEAKSKAMFKLKQMEDVKAEQEAGRQQRWLSRKAWRVHENNLYPYNFGRGRKRYKDPTFRNN